MKISGQFNAQTVFTHGETTRNIHLIGNRADLEPIWTW